MSGHSRCIHQRLVLTILCSSFRPSVCQTASDAKDLTTQLFVTNSYDHRIRPIANQTDQIHVNIDFYLLAVNAVDDVAETLKTTGYLSITWRDVFMAWVPATYGGLTYYHWPQTNVWKPDVTLKNSILDYKVLGNKELNVRVEYTGQVLWEPFQVFESNCKIDITHFPFDRQHCKLKFDAWSYSITEVYLQAGTQGLDLSQYERNSAWDIFETDWYTVEESGEATLVFDITLQRKPLYYALTLVFPVIMLAILDLFVFLLPCDCGEKASYAVTMFLAIAVFMTIMEASFPSNSETFAYFAVYVVIQTVQSTMITFAALLIVRFGSFDEKRRIPMCLILLTDLIKCKDPKKRVSDNNVHHSDGVVEINTGDVKNVDGGEQHRAARVQRSNSPESEIVYTWKSAANAVDKVCFVFFSCALLTSTLVCLLIAKPN